MNMPKITPAASPVAPDGPATVPAQPLLEVEGLTVRFPGQARAALDDVAFRLFAGEGLALVGESGSGKSTCARVLMQLLRPERGHIAFRGRPIDRIPDRSFLQPFRREVQMVFQDPFAALNPAHTVAHHLERPMRLHRGDLDRRQRRAAIVALLGSVGLDSEAVLKRFPHELSGGQRQRVNLARALAVDPSVLIADEPTSMLDVSIRRSVIDIFARLKRERNIALLYITHDIATARSIAETVAVLFQGRIVEMGPTAEVIEAPRHPYSKLLLAAVPEIGVPETPEAARLIARADAVRMASAAPGPLDVVGPGHWVRRTPPLDEIGS